MRFFSMVFKKGFRSTEVTLSFSAPQDAVGHMGPIHLEKNGGFLLSAFNCWKTHSLSYPLPWQVKATALTPPPPSSAPLFCWLGYFTSAGCVLLQQLKSHSSQQTLGEKHKRELTFQLEFSLYASQAREFICFRAGLSTALSGGQQFRPPTPVAQVSTSVFKSYCLWLHWGETMVPSQLFMDWNFVLKYTVLQPNLT